MDGWELYTTLPLEPDPYDLPKAPVQLLIDARRPDEKLTRRDLP